MDKNAEPTHGPARIPWRFRRADKDRSGGEPTVRERTEDADADGRRVRCPLCDWRPDAASRWVCSDCDHPEYFYDSCGASWNTFDTAGQCPGCGHLWRWTMCLACGLWSPHAEWYEDRRPV